MQCDYFDRGRCRSCTFMGMPYAAQLASKQERCAAALAGVAPALTWLAAVAGPDSAFRNKAKLVIAGRAGAVTLGILDHAGRGVDLRECGLYEPGLTRTFPVLADLIDSLRLEPYDVAARRGQLKHLIVTHSPDDELMIRFVLRTAHEIPRIRKALPRLVEALPGIAVVSVNLQPEPKAILEGETELVLTERSTLPMRVNDVVLGLRPNSFFQTNTAVAAALYRQAREWVEDRSPGSVWDLYCGVGGFALHVAGPGRVVVGIELAPDAVDSAVASASDLRGQHPDLGPIRFATADATAQVGADLAGVDLVIVNPPRRGIGPDLAGRLEESDVRDVVYSSCNVDSLARDLAAMPSFRAHEARLFDMFPQSNHHEVMVRLHRT
ncbi:MAG TPA: methyltransferase domain-containing protein [Intrasporangium sp.]|uniref:methyltransferase domain-containing protein n=1 Tax=Intrasporangium sp. TaxID=1925024 RepID=UPI002B4A2F3E|nr:methyltransferase domain-containing protein [Intrasporangium sp.]HKX68903.1 methyltransferase domain-containing protein [Intrasporangium sp.]